MEEQIPQSRDYKFKPDRAENLDRSRRLVVREIILQNFKSYQGRQQIGPFHKRFTSVVGPNGSGKSNLIESLLFIFGKKASWMRLNKLEQLIHSSSNHQEQDQAIVQVHFQEINDKQSEDDYDIIPKTQFAVRRSVNRRGVSNYEIAMNDEFFQKSHQSDVIDLLKSKGIDLNNNRFLILQGEVEQISLMKPKSGDPDKPGLLEYLEDIIGSNLSKERIEKIDEDLGKLNDTRVEKGNRMRLSEEELNKLNDQKNNAIQYIKKEKQIYQIGNVQIQIKRQKANKNIIELDKKQLINEDEQNKQKETYKDLFKKNEKLVQEYKQQKEEIELASALIKKCQIEFQKLTEKDNQVKADMENEARQMSKLKEREDELEKEYRQIIDETNDIRQELPQNERELEKKSEEREREEKKLREMNNRVKENASQVIKEKQDLERELKPIAEKIAELAQHRDILSNKMDLMKPESGDVHFQLTELTEKRAQINIKLHEIQQTRSQIQIAIENIDKIVQDTRAYKNDCIEKINGLDREKGDLEMRIQSSKNSSNDNFVRNTIAKELLRAQQNRELSGICGRLGDLGAIDNRYDIAVTTACFQLDNIIVRRYEDAQRAVEYLREKQLGKASFISLDQISNQNIINAMNHPFQAPRNSERLFDKIKFRHEDYQIAFYNALKDTLVCDDINTAKNIAYGPTRYKVVTFGGDLIEQSGVMSSGGQPRKGGMSSSIPIQTSTEDVNQLIEEIKKIGRQMQQVKSELAGAEEQIRTTLKDMSHAQSEDQKKIIDHDMLVSQLKDIEKQLEGIKNNHGKKSNNEAEIRKIQETLEKINSEYIELQSDQKQFDDQIQIVDERIQEQGGDEYQKLISVVDKLKKVTTELEDQIAKMRAKVANTDQALAQNEKEQKQTATKIDRIEQKIQNLNQEISKIEEDAEQVLGTRKGAEEKQTELQKENKKTDESVRKFEKEISQKKAILDKLTQDSENIKMELRKANDDYKKATHELENHRKLYENIQKGYDFYTDIEEISAYKVSDLQLSGDLASGDGQNERNEETQFNMTGLDVTMVDEGEEDNGNRKTNRRTARVDIADVFKIEVDEDFPIQKMENYQKYADTLKFRLVTEQEKLQQMQSDININTIQQFVKKYNDHQQRQAEFEDVKNRILELKTEVDKLKRERHQQFMSGFNIISTKLKDTYQTLTNGGDAELELKDSLDPFSDGVEFTVRPPGKSWKPINKLSGGQKTLSSLSLVFALHYYRPTPLYFMDEIDAALDYKNVSIVANYLKDRTKNAQFIIISLRNNMFELANKLVGVYKTFDATKTVSIVPEKILLKIRSQNDQNRMEEF